MFIPRVQLYILTLWQGFLFCRYYWDRLKYMFMYELNAAGEIKSQMCILLLLHDNSMDALVASVVTSDGILTPSLVAHFVFEVPKQRLNFQCINVPFLTTNVYSLTHNDNVKMLADLKKSKTSISQLQKYWDLLLWHLKTVVRCILFTLVSVDMCLELAWSPTVVAWLDIVLKVTVYTVYGLAVQTSCQDKNQTMKSKEPSVQRN